MHPSGYEAYDCSGRSLCEEIILLVCTVTLALSKAY